MTKEKTDAYIDELRNALYKAEAITEAASIELLARGTAPDQIDVSSLTESAHDYIKRSLSCLDRMELEKE